MEPVGENEQKGKGIIMADLNSISGIHYEMMRRCYNENSISFKDYGAKGIDVCVEWHDRNNFKNWAIENGYKKGLRLERINTQKGYSPENCRFGTRNKKKSGISQKNKKIREHRRKMKLESGIDGNYYETRIYGIYKGMHSRCETESSSDYPRYGGRGIRVCDEWSGKDGFFHFYKWAMQHGYSDELSIDRIDVNGKYEPNNCRWADNKTQIKNRRNSRNYFYNGKTMSLKEIAEIKGIKYGVLYLRVVKKNMKIEDALDDLNV